MPARDRRRPQTLGDRPVEGGRRIRDNPYLAPKFEQLLLNIGEQIHALRIRKGLSVQQFAEGAEVSERNLFDLFKLAGDPKVSTLMRLGEFADHELVIVYRPKRKPPSCAAAHQTS